MDEQSGDENDDADLDPRIQVSLTCVVSNIQERTCFVGALLNSRSPKLGVFIPFYLAK